MPFRTKTSEKRDSFYENKKPANSCIHCEGINDICFAKVVTAYCVSCQSVTRHRPLRPENLHIRIMWKNQSLAVSKVLNPFPYQFHLHGVWFLQ
jgi:hypothetical protein